ncbi:hypothetical protein [uncultured Dysosmobacter sp.]|uniref:hypothetical protein n=1 Tax=uncultured Dysosmobacter sp. TaxID=2591384 RepID=UPI00261628AF|nr:hypothetical protein [uncultured Dysosmobacter sp.]
MTDCFLQRIAKMMEEQGIVCSFDCCMPQLDRAFWERLAVCRRTDDHKLLEKAGLSTVPRHDFG